MIPISFKSHSLLGTTPVDPITGDIGISFETAGKDIVRIRIDKANADYLFDSIYESHKADACKSKPPTSSEIQRASNQSPIEIKKAFIRAISSLIDEYSGNDFELMSKLEDFARQILIIIDGCSDDISPVFLAVGAYTCDIISSELHHDILRYRIGKNPSRESYKEYFVDNKERKEREEKKNHVHQ